VPPCAALPLGWCVVDEQPVENKLVANNTPAMPTNPGLSMTEPYLALANENGRLSSPKHICMEV
jgi:hypothetical protein